MRKRRQGMVIVDKVEVRVLFDRDRGVCQLCRKRVKLGLKYPNPGMASIDHIIPVSDGGEHSYRNTQLVHLGCNLAKCTKAVGEQLRLVG